MPDEAQFALADFDPNYEDEVYYVYKDKRSTKGCICKSAWCCKCRVMILPVNDEGW